MDRAAAVTTARPPTPPLPPAALGVGSHTAGYVPVQLTAIIPVRVCDVHGEYFDTEMSLDAPMNVLQLAVEDYFKVKPEVQLLLHNRQQINPELTLRGNGCLLLKGDPYVKLTLMVKRGPLLNLICRIARGTHQEVLPIAVNERCTVWDAKRTLCAERAAKRSRQEPAGHGDLVPQQLCILWRYMELNDRAELQYYRIPTNSMLTVRVRKSAAAGRPWSPPRASAAAVGGSEPWARLRQARGPAPLPTAPYDVRGVPPPPPPPLQTRVPGASPLEQRPLAPLAPTEHEVRALQHTVRALQQELAELRGGQLTQQQQQQHHAPLQSPEQSLQLAAAANHRILELEASITRFQGFLERAIALIP